MKIKIGKLKKLISEASDGSDHDCTKTCVPKNAKQLKEASKNAEFWELGGYEATSVIDAIEEAEEKLKQALPFLVGPARRDRTLSRLVDEINKQRTSLRMLARKTH